MKAVILAGGEATRLRPLTCNTPKMMVPVLNRPFLEHLVRYLKGHRIVDVVLAVGKLSGQLHDYLGDGSRLGVSIACSEEPFPMGTAGAVKNAESLLDDSFLVFNGDIFTDIDLTAMIRAHRQNRAMATLALTPVEDPTIYGVVETDDRGRVTRFSEKPRREEVTTNVINAGIYILEPAVLSYIKPDAFSMFERDVFPQLLEKGHAIHGYQSSEYWIDIGTPDKYLRLQHDLLRRSVCDGGTVIATESSLHPSARIEGPVMIGRACSLEANCTIKGPAVLGAGCRVEEEAVVEGAMIWQDCTIGRGARLRNCLVASSCSVGEESEVLDGCILGDEVLIGRRNKLSNGIRIWPGRSIQPDTISF
ncbi:MAG: NDP-sugar synthase [Dehalococcoidia bacterium]|nr:NDP-sugar synthase [Dehalococcoidia bacterium]